MTAYNKQIKNLAQTLQQTQGYLTALATSENFWDVITTSFGSNYDIARVGILFKQWQQEDFSSFPNIEVVSSAVLGDANAAYAASKKTIYLSEAFLVTASSGSLLSALLEEYGHYVDAYINNTDSPGDEGAIFSALVLGAQMDTQTLQALRAENDTKIVNLNGESIQVELQDFTGTNGNDFLIGTVDNDTISGGAGNDTLDAGDGTDYLSGGDGNDSLNGGAGSDNLYGDAGNDTINGGAGDDFLYSGTGIDNIVGGTGDDYLYIDNSTDTANNTITYTEPNNGTIIGGSNNGTTFREIERVELRTGSGNDTINIAAATASGAQNYVYTGDGNDTINGSAGSDNLYGNAGSDTINGGAGNDNLYGDTGNDSLNGGAGSDNLYGNTGNDSLNGGDGNDSLNGGDGNDSLNGGAGSDDLYGNAGNDTINGGDADDYLYSGTGIDNIVGGSGNDYLYIDNSTDTANNTITYTAPNNGTIVGGSNDGTVFREVERVELRTGSGNDTINISAANGSGFLPGNYVYSGAGNDSITGGSGNDVLYSGAGNDTINGGAGDDYLYSGTGIDNIVGGTGNDYLYIDNFTDAANTIITYTAPNNGTIVGGSNDGTIFREIERVELRTGSGNDTINIAAATASGSQNYVYSGDGSDTINGSVGVDNLYGEGGNDTINGGEGTDYLYGGSGNDILDGGAGIDYLYGEGGNDTINGGQGDLILSGGDGNDSITGTAGIDYLYGDAGNDTLYAGDGTDYLLGGDGNDILFGEQGNDTLISGSGNDTLYGALGNDLIVYDYYQNNDVVMDFVHGQDKIDLRNIKIAEWTTFQFLLGNDGQDNATITTQYGSIYSVLKIQGINPNQLQVSDFIFNSFTANDIVDGTNNNDDLFGGLGNDTLNGLAGNDRLFGEQGNDSLNGDYGDDTLYGGSGNDTLYGGNGDDTLYGGSGNDVFIFDYSSGLDLVRDFVRGQDKVDISSFNISDWDVVQKLLSNDPQGNALITTVYGNDQYQFFVQGINANQLQASDFLFNTVNINRTVNGTNYKDQLFGGLGNDSLNGDYGYDTLYGGSGNDTLYGGSGNDTLYGGSGNDVAIYSNPRAQYTITNNNGVYTVVNSAEGTDTLYEIEQIRFSDQTFDIPQGLPVVSLVGLNFSSVLEGGADNLIYTFTRTGSATTPLTVNYSVGGSATNGTDYATIGTSVTFAAGSSSATVTVNPTNDTAIETDETVILTLVSNAAYSVGTTAAVTGTITNDDLPIITIAATDATAAETATGVTANPGTFTLTRTGPTTTALIFNYTLGGTATNGSDYTSIPVTATFAAGSATATVQVSPIDDALIEGSETAILTLATGTGYTLGTNNTATVTIADNDVPIITIAATDATAAETATGVTANPGTFTLTRTGPTTTALIFNYTLGGTATNATDYTSIPVTATFAAGSATATVQISPIDDTVIEGSETAILTLAAGTGYTLGTVNNATVTIADNDFNPTLSINDITVVEGKDANALLTVSLSSPNTQQISVNYSTSPIDAAANVDYTTKTGTLIIPINTSTATISIPILNDNLNEPDEAFTLSLSNPVNATIDPNAGIGEITITDTWKSSLTLTLPSGVENLTLTGTAAINATGNTANNLITGNTANNILTGSAGKDTLTGGAGSDRFGYATLSDSLLGTYDVITDFNNDLFLVSTARTAFNNVGSITTIDAAGIGNALNTTNFGINSTAQFTFASRTFVAINDATAGFNANTDAIIEVTGLTGTLSLSNFVIV